MKPLADLAQILLSSGPPGWAVLTILLLQVGKMLGRVVNLSMKGAWLAWDESKKWIIRLTGWGLVKNLLKAAFLYIAFFGQKLKMLKSSKMPFLIRHQMQPPNNQPTKNYFPRPQKIIEKIFAGMVDFSVSLWHEKQGN